MDPAHQVPLIVVETSVPAKQQIGSAMIEQDGTIVLRIRMVAESSIGDAEMRYRPGSPDYDRVRRHLPSLRFGTSVPVYDDWK